MNLQAIQHLYDFSGNTVVVTGGSGILGSEMVCAFAGLGANVTILSRSGELSAETAERLREAPGRVTALRADVLQRETLVNAEQAIRSRFGAADILINAAGGNRPAAMTGDQPFFDLPEDALRYVTDLNLMGAILSSQVFGRGMADRKKGVIINVTSMSAFRPLTRIVAYSVAKAGVSNFTQWLAVYMAAEYSPDIRVNAIAPGFFITDQNRRILTDPATGALTPRGEAILAHTPMRRFGRPEDLLGAVLWLASPAAAFVTGAVVPIDGGFSAYSGV
jgi:NAD(P)-dependent dehydrogenase (short-subunit alcohol dehydrogenase family)